jgi:hypothetical protein
MVNPNLSISNIGGGAPGQYAAPKDSGRFGQPSSDHGDQYTSAASTISIPLGMIPIQMNTIDSSVKQSFDYRQAENTLPPPVPRKANGLSKSMTGSMHIVDSETGTLPLNIHGLEATDSSLMRYRTRVTDSQHHTIGTNTQNLIEAVQRVEPCSEQLQFSVEVGKPFKKSTQDLGLDTFDRL